MRIKRDFLQKVMGSDATLTGLPSMLDISTAVAALQSSTENEPASHPVPVADQAPAAPRKRGPSIGYLRVLVEEGVLQPGIGVLSVEYNGMLQVADLTPDGIIRCHVAGSDVIFGSPSAFSIHFKRLANPTRQADDGWKTVKYLGKSLERYRDMLPSIREATYSPPNFKRNEGGVPADDDDDPRPPKRAAHHEQQQTGRGVPPSGNPPSLMEVDQRPPPLIQIDIPPPGILMRSIRVVNDFKSAIAQYVNVHPEQREWCLDKWDTMAKALTLEEFLPHYADLTAKFREHEAAAVYSHVRTARRIEPLKAVNESTLIERCAARYGTRHPGQSKWCEEKWEAMFSASSWQEFLLLYKELTLKCREHEARDVYTFVNFFFHSINAGRELHHHTPETKKLYLQTMNDLVLATRASVDPFEFLYKYQAITRYIRRQVPGDMHGCIVQLHKNLADHMRRHPESKAWHDEKINALVAMMNFLPRYEDEMLADASHAEADEEER